jgi:hypothetical protein
MTMQGAMVLPIVTRGGSAHCTGFAPEARRRIAEEVFKLGSFPGFRHHFAIDDWATSMSMRLQGRRARVD